MDKFEKVLPETEIEYTRQIDGATEIRFTFQSEEDYRIPCHLLVPDGVNNPPVVICLQGHSPGMHISLGRPKKQQEESLIKNGDREISLPPFFICLNIHLLPWQQSFLHPLQK